MQRYFDSVADQSGNALQNASVLVTDSLGAAATLYSDNGVTPQPNPIQTNAAGEFFFYAASGVYTLTTTWNGQTDVRNGVQLFDPTDLALNSGAGQVGYNDGATYGAGTVGYRLKQLFSSVGSTLVGFIQSGAAAIARTVQDKLRERVSVVDYGAVGDGTTNDSAAIQAAINAVYAAGGGIVRFPRRAAGYLLGATGLTLPSNVRLVGDVTRYSGSTTKGVTLVYSGTGAAIFGQGILDSQIVNIDIDCTNATGTSVRGVAVDGGWKMTLRNVTVRGATPAKGYGILIDTYTAGGPFGAQHNLLEQIECADGIIRFSGGGSGDNATTTVMNTVRGYQYQIVSSQIVAINATAEAWTTGAGWDWSGAGCKGVMIGCDIEGSGSPGIQTDGIAEVREFGTIWSGFSGAVRVNGNLGTLRTYGGALEFIASLSVGVATLIAKHGNSNAYFISEYLVPVNVTGGAQEGYRQLRRYINGAEVITHEMKDNFRLITSKNCATTATAILTIPISNGTGVYVRAFAYGIDTGNSYIAQSQECVCANNGGTLTTPATSTALKSPAVANGFTFTTSTTNLVVNFAATTGAGTFNFVIEIDGPIIGYTKN